MVASWQSDFCLLFKLIKIFPDLLSMEIVQTCASTYQQYDFQLTLLKKVKTEKISSKNTKQALRNRNAKKTTVLLRRSNDVFIVG